jgi:hypothetical protein
MQIYKNIPNGIFKFKTKSERISMPRLNVIYLNKASFIVEAA